MNDAPGAETGDRPEAPEVERRRQALEEERQRHLRLLASFGNLRPRGARQRDGLLGPARVVVATAEEPVGPWR